MHLAHIHMSITVVGLSAMAGAANAAIDSKLPPRPVSHPVTGADGTSTTGANEHVLGSSHGTSQTHQVMVQSLLNDYLAVNRPVNPPVGLPPLSTTHLSTHTAHEKSLTSAWGPAHAPPITLSTTVPGGLSVSSEKNVLGLPTDGNTPNANSLIVNAPVANPEPASALLWSGFAGISALLAARTGRRRARMGL
jgi:hypothetical protein